MADVESKHSHYYPHPRIFRTFTGRINLGKRIMYKSNFYTTVNDDGILVMRFTNHKDHRQNMPRFKFLLFIIVIIMLLV